MTKNKKSLIIAIAIIIAVAFFIGVVPTMKIVPSAYNVNDSDTAIDIFDVQKVYVNIGSTDEKYNVNEIDDTDIFDVQLVFINIGNTPDGQTIFEWGIEQWS